ncbi:MAG: hypothetical protein ABIR18_01970 [Chitinophagaceae bacterium]
MPDTIDIILKMVMASLMLLIGLAAFIGGLKRKPNPFFWIKDFKAIYLKTPTHYLIFGIVCILLSIFFLVRFITIYNRHGQ